MPETRKRNKALLSDLSEQYISECRYASGIRPSTVRGYGAVLKLLKNLAPEIEYVSDLTPEMFTLFFKRLQTRERLVGRDQVRKGVKNSTIHTYRSKLNTFVEWLKEKKHLKKNPLDQVKKVTPVYEDSRALKKEEVDKIYASIVSHSKNTFFIRRDTMIISLLLYTGIRFGELIGLQVKDVDLDKDILTVQGKSSKSKETRYIPIHPTLRMHIKDYLDERNRKRYTTEKLIVSSTKDIGLTMHGIKHWTKRLIEKSGVVFHLHRFRHTFACRLAENDTNAFKIQKLMGHKRLSMTMQYVRSIQSEDTREDILKI